jgi:hypothetical protein
MIPGASMRTISTVLLLAALAVTTLRSQTWQYTASMSVERRMLTLTVLEDNTVLAIGGADANSRSLATCEIYDPATASWAMTAPMQTPRVRHTATKLADGRVVVIGGDVSGDAAVRPTPSIEIYDPATRRWSPGGNLLVARMNHTATLLPDGRILVVGGYNGSFLAECEIYDPATGSVTVTAPLLRGRMDHQSILLANGSVMMCGGRIGGTNGLFLNDCEIYDPATATWRAADAMHQSRIAGYSLLRFSDGGVLAAGGRNSPTSSAPGSEIYDPATMTWRSTDPMKLPCAWQGGVLLPFDQYLITGGIIDANWADANNINATATCEWYDRFDGKWYFAPSLNQPRAEHEIAYLHQTVNPALPTELILVAGGRITGQSRYTSTCEYLDMGVAAVNRYKEEQAALAGIPPASAPISPLVIAGNMGGSPKAIIDNDREETLTLDLVTVDGVIVRRIGDFHLDPGDHAIPIDIRGLPPALYFVRAGSGSGVRLARLLVGI